MNNHIPSTSGVVIRPASFNDIPYIQDIAKETWPVAYGKILSNDQLQYMLGLLYSAPSLQQQIHDNHHFFLALDNYSPVGFASFSHIEQDVYKLQKLYVLPTVQKSGAGKKLLETVITTAQSMGAKQLLLNVNRNNNALSFYEKHGFKIIKEEDIDIDNGYFMNDYVMAKNVAEGDL
jgi:ribosomal protein S18 acetylase RimI-like enzyme